MLPQFEEIRIENTNACGYRCFMCPREKQTRKIGFMSVEDFKLVLSKLPKDKASMDLHGYGEPFLDKHLLEKIDLAARHGPFSTRVFSTLGLEFTDQELKMLALSKLSILNISMYGYNRESYKQIHGTDKFDLVQKNISRLIQYIEELGSSLQLFIKVYKYENETQNFHDLMEYKKLLSSYARRFVKIIYLEKWHNYGNGRAFNPFSKKLCPVVEGHRKNILQITWDLHVIPCCFDFDASLKFGNLRHHTLEEIFTSESYKEFIENHKKGDLSQMLVCQGCEKN
jgi:radical SAM protein with 4Fe4S-binding SPASM domain